MGVIPRRNDEHIFTSLRVDVDKGNAAEPSKSLVIHHLNYHRDRLLAAAQALGWSAIEKLLVDASGLQLLHDAIQFQSQSISCHGPQKMNIYCFNNGEITTKSMSISAQNSGQVAEFLLPTSFNECGYKSAPCRVMLDTELTASSLHTTHKTSRREHYDQARVRAQVEHDPPNISEVLLRNSANEVMEASLSTPYFFRDSRWVTPASSSGGNLGTTRRWAIEKGLCLEDVVLAETLQDGETIWISNGVRGFTHGVMQIS